MNDKLKKGIVVSATVLALGGGGTIIADNQINPYTDKIDRVEMLTIADVPDAGEQKVELMKDKPEVRFKKWNGEVDLGLTYDAVKSTGNRPFLSDKMEYKDTKQEVFAYPLTDGFEIEVILKEKPKTNVVSFTLDNYENLDFWYQPVLTQQEIDEGSSRPENIVGSYAVYSKEKANHIVGQTNYATGKVGHIFRPKIIDSVGTKVWGDLHIENGILSVTIPQVFLDNAVYPVLVDPTFGYTGIGASTNGSGTDNMRATRFASPENGTVSKLTVYGNRITGTPSFKGVMMNDDANFTLLTNGVASGVAVPASAAWTDTTFSTPPNISNGVNYYLGAVISANYFVIYFDEFTAFNSLYDGTNSYTTPQDAGSQATDDWKNSIYATYTASGGEGGGGDGSGVIIFDE